MDTNIYNPLDVAGKAVEVLQDSATLSQYNTAQTILPADTQFAIVAEVIERNTGESFTETAITGLPTVGSSGVGAEVAAATGPSAGIKGRFVGYISIGGGQLRVHRDGQLVFADQLPNVKSGINSGSIVIGNAAKTYMVIHPYQINGADGHFESKAIGLNNGLSPLLEKIAAGGGNVDQQAIKKSNATVLIFIIIIVAAMAAFILL